MPLPLMPKFTLPYLYKSNTIWEFNQMLITAALEEKTQTAHDFAMYLLRYQNTVNNFEHRKQLHLWLNELKAANSRRFPNVLTTQFSRRKCLSRTITKGVSLIKNSNGCKELENVHDFLALCTILLNNDINSQYKIANHSFEYFVAIGLNSMLAKPLKDTESFDLEKHPSLQLTNSSGLKKKFKPFFKDYVEKPKANGYQSLHTNFTDTQTELSFELQIKTFNQFVYANNLAANHEDFRKKQLSALNCELVEVDPKKVHIYGVYLSDTDVVEDVVGLFKPIHMNTLEL